LAAIAILLCLVIICGGLSANRTGATITRTLKQLLFLFRFLFFHDVGKEIGDMVKMSGVPPRDL
jgi:hypothetical protein